MRYAEDNSVVTYPAVTLPTLREVMRRTVAELAEVLAKGGTPDKIQFNAITHAANDIRVSKALATKNARQLAWDGLGEHVQNQFIEDALNQPA
jgi:hypothetical protein